MWLPHVGGHGSGIAFRGGRVPPPGRRGDNDEAGMGPVQAPSRPTTALRRSLCDSGNYLRVERFVVVFPAIGLPGLVHAPGESDGVRIVFVAEL